LTPAAELDKHRMVMSPDAFITFAIVMPAEVVDKVDAFTLVTNPLTGVQGAVVQP
jgi:hypothetical protein